jgi:hypothetical protein
MIVLVLLLAFAACYYLYESSFYSCPSLGNVVDCQDETIVHQYADRYLRSLEKGIEREYGIAADELFAFMYITGITRFSYKGKTFVVQKQLLA